MDTARFEEGFGIREYVDTVVAHAKEWRDRFDAAEPRAVLDGPSGIRIAVISEDWSWECAMVLPSILRCLASSPGVETRIFPRDEHLDLALEFCPPDPLSIPRLAFLDPDGTILARWGPRAEAAERVLREKEALRPKSERIWRLREWYAGDRGRAGAEEVLAILRSMKGLAGKDEAP